ncbi:MAG TPA: cystathionine beta-lyase [Candidatus Angelobacter sp.]|jgi:cystathionine beta-lyase|nr:cystathionine beta-lyase [Candidatus Angelobacter sp.]
MKKDWTTKLIHSDAQVPEGFQSLVTPVYRGSTVLFPEAAAASDHWNQHEVGYTYGLFGTPTTLELAAKICELENGFRTLITPGGQGAIALIHLSLLKTGDHVLLPESIYGPNRRLANDVLRRFGVEASYYPPTSGSEIESAFRANTHLVWCESPGSVTMEVQDVPAIAEVAHHHGVMVVLDNTWSSGVYFDAFAHGVDVTMQALTKYIGGHSDLLLGSVTARDAATYELLGETSQLLGCAASPDDCSMALRGMKTLSVRLKAVEESACAVARWLQERPEVKLVLHPALPSCPGHEIWKRDFTGSTGLFSFVFGDEFTKEQVLAFVDALELFEIGYSWGGVTSLAMAYALHSPKRPNYGSRIVRLYIGLENIEDLKADLAQAFEKIVLSR